MDTKTIMYQSLKGKHETKLFNTYTKIQIRVRKRVFKPKLHRLDNKALKSLKTFMVDMEEYYQYAPSYIHI